MIRYLVVAKFRGGIYRPVALYRSSRPAYGEARRLRSFGDRAHVRAVEMS